MAIPTISVIIPVYNEERTLPTIVEIFLSWGKADEIIIVNDGSTDNTTASVSQFLKQVRLISYKKNRGKGYALSRGIRASRGDILVFFDGDVYGLTRRDLDLLLDPVRTGSADMVIALARFWSMGKYAPFDDLSGERAIRREDIMPHVTALERLGYGVELFLNDLYRNRRIVRVKLPFVSILKKIEKQSVPLAAQSYLRETKELMAQYVNQQARDGSAHVKPLLRHIQNYLRYALEYLQLE